MGRRRIVLVLVTVASTLAWASQAAAVPVTIDFENTSVLAFTAQRIPFTWYQGLSGNAGISFGTRGQLGLPATLGGANPWGCTTSTDAPLANNGSSVARSGQLSARFTPCTTGDVGGLAGALLRCDVDCASVDLYAGQAAASPDVLRANGYSAAGDLVASDTAALTTAGARNHLTLADAQSRISFVTLFGDGGGFQGDLYVDDLTFTPNPAAAPDFQLSLAATFQKLSVVRGRSSTATVNLFRRNGSTGAVDLSMTGLPPGVTASFDPATLDGTTTSSTLTLTATPSAATGEVTAQIVGTPQNPVAAGPGTPLSLPVRVDPPFALRAASTGTTSIALCTPTRIAAILSVEPGYTDPIKLEASVLDGSSNVLAGETATLDTTTITPQNIGLGGIPVTVRLSPKAPRFPASVAVRAFNDTDQSGVLIPIAEIRAPTVASISRAQAAPLTGSIFSQAVSIDGAGFCGGETIRFGSDAAQVAPASLTSLTTPLIDPKTSRAVPAIPQAQRLTVTVPRYAASGQVTVSGPDDSWDTPDKTTTKVLAAGDLQVLDWRASNGFAFPNFRLKSVGFGDMTRAFGREQTHFKVDFCFPLGCDVWIPDPIVGLGTAALSIGMSVNSGSAVCFGMSSTVLRLRQGTLPFAGFPPTSATNAFGLTPFDQSVPLAQELIAAQLRQYGLEYLKEYMATFLGASGLDAGGVAALVRQKLAQVPGGVMISMPQGLFDGHVVVAYDVADLPNGGYAIQVYDPNRPWKPEEDIDTSGATHVKRLDESRILLSGKAYTFKLDDSNTYTGGTSNLYVLDAAHVRSRPTIPFGVAGLVNGLLSWQPGDPPPLFPASASGARPAATSALGFPGGSSNLVPLPLTATSGRGGMFLVRGGGPARLPVRTSGGPVTGFAQGPGGAVQVRLGPGGSAVPALALERGGYGLDLGDARRSLSTTLTAGDRASRSTVLVETSTSGESRFSLGRRGAFAWSGERAATLRISTQRVTSNGRDGAATATVRLPAGGRVSIGPAGRVLAVRSRSGAVTRRPLRVGGGPRLAVGRVRAGFTGRTLRVSGRLVVPAGFTGRDGTVTATVLRGRRVVASRTLTLNRLRRTQTVRLDVPLRPRAGLRVALGAGAVNRSGIVAAGVARGAVGQ